MDLDMYRKLYRVRAVELRAAQWHKGGLTTSPPHFSIGSEAMAVGLCEALKRDDLIYLNHRCHAMYLARGGDLVHFKKALTGNGGAGVNGVGSMHLADPGHGIMGGSAIIGGAVPIALGAAFAQALGDTGRRVVVWGGDTLWECGYFWESLNVALSKRLNILFVVERNNVATYSDPTNRHGLRELLLRLRHGPVYEADGSDVDDVIVMARRALSDLPAILEVNVTRHCGHTGGEIEVALGDYRDCVYNARMQLPSQAAKDVEDEVDADLGRLGF